MEIQIIKVILYNHNFSSKETLILFKFHKILDFTWLNTMTLILYVLLESIDVNLLKLHHRRL